MSNKTIRNQDLTPNTYFYVRGELSYARLTSHIDGEELRKSNERKKARGMITIDRPHTSATVNNAIVVVRDPNNLTKEETYARESMYTTTNSTGYSFSAINKGRYLPWIAVRNQDGTVDQIKPQGELAQGLKVTLCMRIFESGQIYKGVTLDGVIVEEPIRYYNLNDTVSQLAENGIIFKPNAEAERARMNPEQNAQAQETPTETMPAQQHQPQLNNPYAIQTASPYTNTPVQTTPMQQTTPYNTQQTAHMNQNINSANATHYAQNNGIVQNHPQEPVQQGIRYNPNETVINTGNRNY